jgi:Alr-MurF fusion protein
MVAHSLEPEIYNLNQLKAFATFLDGKPYRIHLKLDTGMHRLGLDDHDLTEAIGVLQNNPSIEIASVFSHLAGADEETHDEFTQGQATKFLSLSSRLQTELRMKPVLHLLNSSGILRFPEYQFGMVRLGISLYGINPTSQTTPVLRPVATLKTIISQIKRIPKGETIGYGRKGKAEKEMLLATLAIGYADGFSRAFSRGVGEVLINGTRAPVIGNVCMDMTMVDITGIEAAEGDEVIIFGKGLPITEIAAKINTIPYEILTGTSERVKRVFYAESI